MTERKIRLLTFSTLYPSSVRPGHGIFVETRLRELLKSGEVDAKVVAPVPWFFSKKPIFGDYALMAQVPQCEVHNQIDVRHPRYFLPPKIGMSAAPLLMALGAVSTIRRLLDEGFDFDLIDAHYYYPDGVAAALLAKWFHKPFVVTARGTDINLLPRYAIPRKWICWTAQQASASITVSRALCETLAALGVDRSKLQVLRNGVDIRRFHPIPLAAARAELGLPDAPTLLSVGNLIENKGHHIAIELIARMSDFQLVIVGGGPEQGALEQLARNLGVYERISFVGRIAQDRLPLYYSAADVLVLASSREGWPNVLLEAMACGTPVVATNVGGVPEVVTAHEAGRLVDQRDVAHFASGLESLLRTYPDRKCVRAYAEGFGWQATSDGQLALFKQIAAHRADGALEPTVGRP